MTTLTNDRTELEEYQEWVASTTSIQIPEDFKGYWASSILVCEATEVLELHEKALRKHGTPVADVDRVIDELGDTLWTAAAVANAYGIKLDEVIENNIQKINLRVYGDKNGSVSD